ncbi:AFG1/ZapE family ATPase, partial [Microbacterium flavum]|uniref:AFG1/ZapE family ATPase n=1 Tax=Microbacterium flavum TaxID=415216 RepID=UPI0024AE4BCC
PRPPPPPTPPRARPGPARALDDAAYAQALADAGAAGTVSDDDFGALVSHLASVHPSRYIRLIDGISAIGLREVVQLEDQSAALRFVAFVDRAYDAQLPVRATGRPLDEVFAPEMLTGGYRKKYLRAISRLNALTHS